MLALSRFVVCHQSFFSTAAIPVLQNPCLLCNCMHRVKDRDIDRDRPIEMEIDLKSLRLKKEDTIDRKKIRRRNRAADPFAGRD